MFADNDDYDDQDADDDQDAGDDQSDNAQDAHQAVANAAPEEVDAHRGLLSEAFQLLEGRGVDTSALAARAGASTDDPDDMSHGDLISTTLALARQHPVVVQEVALRFPEAQGILGAVLGSSGDQGGGFLSSILSRL